MARFCEPTPKQLKGYKAWVRKRPPVVRAVAERFDPWTLYRMGDHRVYVLSFAGDGTLTVAITGQFNRVLFARQVFGVPPDSLEECDLPDEDEVLGLVIAETTEEDIKAAAKAAGIRHKHEVN